MRSVLSGSRGMAPLVLVILIAWALLSVMFLTGTLLAARSIDRSVAIIKPNVSDIGGDARFIRQAKTIAETSTEIDKAAKPLVGHLDRTLEVASKGIDPQLKSILQKVGEINQTAGSINSSVLAIGATVDSIFGNASSINSSVHSINAHAHSIGRRGRTILASATSINSSVRGILGNAGAILSRVSSIDGKVATIVGQANAVIGVAVPIGTDLHTVATLVGGGPGVHGGTIHGAANGIDCSPLLVSSTYCGK